jgi:hypothetical protein
MTTRVHRIEGMTPAASAPKYEIRIRYHAPSDSMLEVWNLPSPASSHVTSPVRLAGLRGRNLELVEHRVLKRLAQAGVKLISEPNSRSLGYAISEDIALMIGLLFRTLAPMRSREKMRAVAEGIEQMGREEAAYWLGMAMHRKNPRRVLTALRFLLTEPKSAKKK